MMQPLPSLTALRAFEAAVRRGSFAAAAGELCLTPSAVSHQIKLLEDHLRVRLFHRIRRSVVPTDSGRRYYEEVSAAFGRIKTATNELRRVGKSDRLSIHAAPSFATQWLMPRLSRFVAMHPELDVLFSSTPGVRDFSASEFDIDIQYGQHDMTGLVVIPLPVERVVPMCSPRLVEGVRAIHAADDLQLHAVIHSDRCLVQWRDWLAGHPELNLDLTRGLHFDRSFMSISAAVAGLGVCLESTLLAKTELDSGQLARPLGNDGIDVQGHRLVCRIEKADLPKIVAFTRWLSQALTTM
jgi:LysR family transcriptional regulator, glycine cleavage system transcriptional activator